MCWLIACWMADTCSLHGAAPVIPEDVKTTIRQRVDYGYAPGMIVGLRNTDGAAFFAYGQTDRHGGEPVDERTIFEIGSITKVFTGTVLADMTERGEVHLTDPVQQYVPPSVQVPTFRGSTITLTHLATHASGLPSIPENLPLTNGSNPFAGYTIGHRAFAGFLRNGNTLAVALSNSDFDVTDVGFHLLDATSPLVTVRQPAAVPLETLRHYVGRYEAAADDHFTLGLLEGRLTLEYSRDNGRRFTLYPTSSTRFYLTFPEAEATFASNPAGEATSLTWNQSGYTTTYPKATQRPLLSALRTANTFQLQLSGDTDRNYVIEISTDLLGWTAISTNTIWDNPILDPTDAADDHRFYRVHEQ